MDGHIDGIDSGIDGQEVFIDGIDGKEGEAELDSLHRLEDWCNLEYLASQGCHGKYRYL